jgi:hypothetical protein
MVNLVCPSCPWFVLAPKVFQLCTNYFVLVLCRSVWVSEACHLFLVPSWNSSMPLYPMLRIRERASTPCSSAIFSLGLTFESLKELGVRHILWSSTLYNAHLQKVNTIIIQQEFKLIHNSTHQELLNTNQCQVPSKYQITITTSSNIT